MKKNKNEVPIWKNKIFICLEILFLFVSIAFLIFQFVSLRVGIRTINNIFGDDVYILSDISIPEHIDNLMMSRPADELNKLHTYIYQNTSQQFTMINFGSIFYEEYNISSIRRFINEDLFFKFPKIELNQGRNFTSKDFHWTSTDVVPMIVGYDLKEIFSLGSIHTLYHNSWDSNLGLFDVKIIGIISEDFYFPNISRPEQKDFLNDSYILPFNYYFFKNGYADWSTLDMTLFFTLYQVDYYDAIDNIISLSEELGLFHMEGLNLNEALSRYFDSSFRTSIEIVSIAIIVNIIFVLILIFIKYYIARHKLNKTYT